MAEDPSARLLGDIGVTNARFDWQATPSRSIEHCLTLPCSDSLGSRRRCERIWLAIGKPTPRSSFRRRFEGEGRFEGKGCSDIYLSARPAFVIDTPSSPAPQGAANALNG